MKFIDVQDKTIESAIEKGVLELGTTAENVEVTILKQPGMFSKAKVRLTIIEENMAKPSAEETMEASPEIEETLSEEVLTQNADVSTPAQDIEVSTPAGEILAKICKMINPNITISETQKDHIVIYEIAGQGSENLIGKGGAGIDSLQIVLNSINRRKQENASHIVIRIDEYEKTKEEKLHKLAVESANKAIEINNTVRLPIMNSYERRIVHSFLQDDDRVITESFGVEPYRYTTVRPKDKE